jgi:hypothetical protein
VNGGPPVFLVGGGGGEENRWSHRERGHRAPGSKAKVGRGYSRG